MRPGDDGENVSTLMQGAGLGCIDERFEYEAADVDQNDASAAHRHPQAARRGMWIQSAPMCVVDYRRATR